ncbi:MAG: leucine-rich repeat domain-containing protein [Promethearchaeota archaeon]
MLKYKINKHLSLRLEEDDNTIIYVNNEPFYQCKFLLLNIPITDYEDLDDVQSIDEASEMLDNKLETENNTNILPEQEFWAHCSNLQVWYEYGYNTNLLHRSLAFPLLKKLSEVGDNQAERVFKEEIAKRLMSGYPTVVKYLIEEGYLKYLSNEETINSMLDSDAEVIEEICNLFNYDIDLDWNYGTDDCSSNIGVKNKKVVQIAFVDADLTELPESIGNLVDLEVLWLPNSNLQILPESIKNLKKLKILNLNLNELKEIPESVGELEDLEILELAGNRLTHLPESMGKLKKLQVLRLNDNKLEEIPKSFENLKSLRKLSLYGNKLLKKNKDLENIF